MRGSCCGRYRKRVELTTWAGELAARRLSQRLPRRWAHVQGVCRRVRAAGRLFAPTDADLLAAAGLVHDIGYAPELVDTGLHSLDGARYLRSVEAPQRLCALVAHHSAAYLEAGLRGLGDELADWADERTALRDALWWADMTTSPDGDVVSFEERVIEIRQRYGPDEVVSRCVQLARQELEGAINRTEDRLWEAGVDYV
ncbi:HD domain-containing protein [Amycolatopsis lurida]|nr:HD domain-containing protein [Amycolatopsis lurida]